MWPQFQVQLILTTALGSGNFSNQELRQLSLVNNLPDVLTQSRVFISGNTIPVMVPYIQVGGRQKQQVRVGNNCVGEV